MNSASPFTTSTPFKSPTPSRSSRGRDSISRTTPFLFNRGTAEGATATPKHNATQAANAEFSIIGNDRTLMPEVSPPRISAASNIISNEEFIAPFSSGPSPLDVGREISDDEDVMDVTPMSKVRFSALKPNGQPEFAAPNTHDHNTPIAKPIAGISGTPASRPSPLHSQNWVVVYGYDPSSSYESVLDRFRSYGKIISVCPPPRGQPLWVCLEYSSSTQAEKALCQDGSLHQNFSGVSVGIGDGISMIGVKRMDARRAVDLGVDGGGKSTADQWLGTDRLLCSEAKENEADRRSAVPMSGKSMEQGENLFEDHRTDFTIGVAANDEGIYASEKRIYKKPYNLFERFLFWVHEWEE
eukprot:CAMPEP_0194286210 /NCGR_PEP_ID=MMETSP0169-20130528/32047_1 /TAXON_ID=218684 /ORGANISM="Corethron pennatum, Strain L29A3" /LENGTH=354 /DNA_ID=CAMNT_0039032581 /DNA_START=31 /DNA_END=1095 /DNA_ORIENTATION=+